MSVITESCYLLWGWRGRQRASVEGPVDAGCSCCSSVLPDFQNWECIFIYFKWNCVSKGFLYLCWERNATGNGVFWWLSSVRGTSCFRRTAVLRSAQLQPPESFFVSSNSLGGPVISYSISTKYIRSPSSAAPVIAAQQLTLRGDCVILWKRRRQASFCFDVNTAALWSRSWDDPRRRCVNSQRGAAGS